MILHLRLRGDSVTSSVEDLYLSSYAIYPAVVIILVAQNRSHMVKAFGGGAVNIPEPSHLDGIRVPSATVLPIARQGYQVGDVSEESSTHAAD
ncbi:hypothetical protein BD310DRAFT_941755, partial [Dichomitus squalens]